MVVSEKNEKICVVRRTISCPNDLQDTSITAFLNQHGCRVEFGHTAGSGQPHLFIIFSVVNDVGVGTFLKDGGQRTINVYIDIYIE